MNAVRLNITIPKEIAKQLERLVGPKGKSAFITECIRQRIEQIKKEKLQELLKEGYKNNKSESITITKEFESIDLEGWDEYLKRWDLYGVIGSRDWYGNIENSSRFGNFQ